MHTRFVYKESVTSTNEEARRLAEEGVPEGTVVLAEEQTAGKGRSGRSWYSPRGEGIWMSVVLRPSASPHLAPLLSPIGALSIARSIEDTLGIPAVLKWPNDVLVCGRKVSGVLAEAETESNRLRFVILGLGVNVNQTQFPPYLRELATSLRLAYGHRVVQSDLVHTILDHLSDYYQRYEKGELEGIVHEVKAHMPWLGQQVVISDGKHNVEVVAEDIDAHGCLVIRRVDGSVKRVVAGEMSLVVPLSEHRRSHVRFHADCR
jgi:BirA family biotin operon repressor/biotin-[acetyl-CoA-carboxylase] ligase